MPNQPVRVRILVDNLDSFRNPLIFGFSSMLCNVLDTAAGLLKEHRLTSRIYAGSSLTLIRFDFVPVYIKRWHSVARVVIAQIAWLMDKYRPRCNPKPKALFFVRIELKVAGFLAITLKESRHRLPSIHYAKEVGVVNQLNELIRRRCCGCHKSILDGAKQHGELLRRFRPVGSQATSFV